MAQFHTTTGSVSFIESIISSSNKELVIISPYIKLDKRFLERLVRKAEDGVKIVVICRINDLNKDKDELNNLKSIKNIVIRSLNDLHAKCYYNGEDMLLTSMNLYTHSQNNNYEMGISINRLIDKDLFQPAQKEMELIVRASELIFENKPAKKTYQSNQKELDGICIRCHNSIEFDFDKPLCKSCFSSWLKFENIDYPENYCMNCGKSAQVSFGRPVCYPCYKKNN